MDTQEKRKEETIKLKKCLPVTEVVLFLGSYCWLLSTAWGYACLDCSVCILYKQLPWIGQGNTPSMYCNGGTPATSTLSGKKTFCTEQHVARVAEFVCLFAYLDLAVSVWLLGSQSFQTCVHICLSSLTVLYSIHKQYN